MNKENYIMVSVWDAGMFGNRYHSYIFNNKLFKGKGYQSIGCSEFDYYPESDEILLDDISNMDMKELKKIH